MGEIVLLGSQQEEADRNKAMFDLRRIAGQLADTHVQTRCEVHVSSSVATGILEFAEREKVDLIAMYTHDRKGLAKLFRGSVAREVERRATAQVQVFGPAELAELPASEIGVREATTTDSVIFKDVDILKGLSDEQVGRVVSLGHRLQVSEGETLGKGGQLGQSLFVIVDGEAHLTAHSEIGEIAVRVAGPEESFPLAVLLGEGTLITSGEALTSMELLEIPRTQLLDLCSQDTAIGMRIYSAVAAVLANRYRRTLEHLTARADVALREADFFANV